MDKTIEISLTLPEAMVARLEAEGERLHTPLNLLVKNAVEGYLNTLDADEETPDEDIIAGIRRGMRQALRGEVRPAMDALDAIEREFADE